MCLSHCGWVGCCPWFFVKHYSCPVTDSRHRNYFIVREWVADELRRTRDGQCGLELCISFYSNPISVHESFIYSQSGRWNSHINTFGFTSDPFRNFNNKDTGARVNIGQHNCNNCIRRMVNPDWPFYSSIIAKLEMLIGFCFCCWGGWLTGPHSRIIIVQ